MDLLVDAVGGCDDPAWGDDGPSAEVVPVELQADLPGPLTGGGRVASHDPWPVAGPRPTRCQKAKIMVHGGNAGMVLVTFSPSTPSLAEVGRSLQQDRPHHRGPHLGLWVPPEVSPPPSHPCSIMSGSRYGGCGAHIFSPAVVALS